jgi:hypothetical protein
MSVAKAVPELSAAISRTPKMWVASRPQVITSVSMFQA